ncbi:MAG TPA: tetratricopeptide repeat protein, partial [Roseiflexaceae bacterium]|nr:tetratricopeptide repeat protein [Roseiflexaceae bacterium]
VALYRGDFLAQFYLPDSIPFEEWALLKREHLHRLMMQALIQLVNYYERHADYAQTQRFAYCQLELDPWREEAHRQLMRVLVLSGQRSAALAQYETCRRILVRDLSVEPEAATTALYEQIRDQQTWRPGDQDTNAQEHGQPFSLSPALLVSTSARHNFPAQTTLLIGRETELVELGAWLENPACRLVTIVGPGGIGKTRLALAAATEQAQAFTHGAAFVPLAAIHSATFLASAIMTALDVALQGQRDPRDQLLEYLREKELLLLLDNFEQLLAPDVREEESGAVLLTDMLQRAPSVTLLVTSRERLALPGEWLFDLAGLSYPLGDPIAGVEAYDSVRLFLQRAGQVRRQFALVESETRAVARICRLVEGLPLAIELAVAGLRGRSCMAIADAIESSLSVLTTGLRAIPERHRSVWATFEHSWRLLSDEERQVFPRLSVFRGGFEEEAAAQVAQATPQLLAMLMDKSLLRWDGVARYDMHELVRQYAGEKLEQAGETETLHRRHGECYLALAEAAEPKLHDADQRVWLNRLEAEHDNLRAALAWSLSAQDNLAMGVQLAGTLWPFWHLRGYLSEGRDWLARLLARVQESGAPASVRAKALHGAGALANVQGDYVQALVLCGESLALFRELEDKHSMAMALGELGFVAQQQGDYEQARGFHEESLAIFRELGEKHGIANAIYSLGRVARNLGDYRRATTLYQEGLNLFREQGDRWGIGIALGSLGMMAWLMGNYAEASALFEQGLIVWQELAHTSGIADTLNHLGLVAREQGDYATARALFEQSLALQREQGRDDRIALSLHDLGTVARHQGEYGRARMLLEESLALVRQLGDKGAIALVLSHLGQLAQAEGDFGRAAGHYDESLRLFSGLEDKAGIAWCLVELAEVCQAQGQPERAVRLLAAAEALLAAIGRGLEPAVRADYERSLAVARVQLDEATFAAAWAAGRAMTLEQAMAYALEESEIDSASSIATAAPQ